MANGYHGKSGVIYMSTSASGTATTVGRLSKWSLDQSTDTVEVTSFGDTNKVYVQGLKDLKGSFSGFWEDTTTLFTAADSTDGVKLYLYPSSNAPTKYWYGTAWLNASIDTDNNGAVTLNGNFVAASSWGRQ